VISYVDQTDDDASFQVWDYLGNQAVAETDIDTEVEISYQTSVSALNSSLFVYGYLDDFDNDISFGISYSNGSGYVSPIDVDSSIGTQWHTPVAVATINETLFVIAWWDNDGSNDISFQTYYSNGTAFSDVVDASDIGAEYLDVASYAASTGISICEDNETFVIAFANSSGGYIESYYSNGSMWNGICLETDPCICPGLNNNWEIGLSDNCYIDSDCDLGTGKLSFTGTGTATCGANIYTSSLGDPGSGGTLFIDSTCTIFVS